MKAVGFLTRSVVQSTTTLTKVCNLTQDFIPALFFLFKNSTPTAGHLPERVKALEQKSRPESE